MIAAGAPAPRRSTRLIALTLFAFTVLVAPVHAASQNVGIGEFFYRADRVRIDPGDSVTWTNRGEVLHTVTSRRGAPQGFNSGLVDSGQTFSRAFTRAGTYDYVCTLHPGLMAGVVQVGPDRVKPVVRRLAAKAGKTVRVAFRLSEKSRVTIKLTRHGWTVRTLRTRRAVSGSEVRRLKLPAAGRYRVTVTATDLAGNKRAARTAVTVR